LLNPIPGIVPLIEAGQVLTDLDSVATPSAHRKACPAQDASRRFRQIERNQPARMVVDLGRMPNESHAARAIWEFVGGLGRFEGCVKGKVNGADRDSRSHRLLRSLWT
jgi:hypothetical protein